MLSLSNSCLYVYQSNEFLKRFPQFGVNDHEMDIKNKSFPSANGVSGELSGSCLCHCSLLASLGWSEGPPG